MILISEAERFPTKLSPSRIAIPETRFFEIILKRSISGELA